jgi:hypothetical protein
MMDDWTKDRYRPRQKVPAYRDLGDATVLHRWPKALPLRAVLKDALPHLEVLLSRLERGVYCPKDERAHYEQTARELYLRSQNQVRVLRDALDLAELE